MKNPRGEGEARAPDGPGLCLFWADSRLDGKRHYADSSSMATTTVPTKPRVHLWLWIVQGLLATLFLFTGVSKLAMPTDVLAQQSHLPGLFMKFIGVCEVLGAFGLILPGLTHIRPWLTPLAAALLVIIMIGATVSTAIMLPSVLPLPAIVLLLTAFVAYGRWRLAPLE